MGVDFTRAARRARLHGMLMAGVALFAAPPVRAAVILTPSRAEALYSADPDPDCSALSMLADDKLPMNVIRLRATVPGDPPGLHYRWSAPKDQVGMLAADLDLGPGQETGAIRALCADFGNACTLTADKLPFYDQPTVLWIAPTCEVLTEKNTSRRRNGAAIRVAVKVTQGKRRLGKASTRPALGYGRAASVTLSIDGRDGIGVPASLGVPINPTFEAKVAAAGLGLPGGGVFEFTNGAGGFAAVSSCSDPSFDACAGFMLYQQTGTFIPTVKDRFDDGSALCDNARVHVLTANIIPRLTVSAKPKGTYVPGNPMRGTVRLRVTLRNASPRQGGSDIVLLGSNILTCDSELRLAGTKDVRQTVFDTRHCSVTRGQPCNDDHDCRGFVCPDCTPTETCLLESHCSQTLDQLCQGDVDCRKPACKGCQDGELCIRVLHTPAIVIPIGEPVDLVDTVVSVRNIFPDVAHVVDKWTVNTFNAGSLDATLRYSIRPGPTGP